MGWFLHISEDESGRWVCSRGTAHFDRHDDLVDAVSHMQAEIRALGPTGAIYLHLRDGTTERIAVLTEP